MAANNIILSDGSVITPEDLQKIAAETKKLLAADSKELSQFEEVSSLEELTSLPGIAKSGTAMKLVRVAMSVLKGVDGKTVELSASDTAIQWRYLGESEWRTLVDLSLLKGDKGDAGDKIVLRKGESAIEWKYENEEDSAYRNLVDIDDIRLKYVDLSESDKAELTKIPVLSTVNASTGTGSSGSFSADGVDENGNPKYILNLTMQKGDKGEAPVLEVGSVVTGLPNSEVSVELIYQGDTEAGNPRYKMNVSIPKGEPGQNGTGSGNVFVQETGLVAGKQYLFRPSSPNSASGTFIEYVAPDTSAFITSTVENLANYYLKTETYSREEVNQMFGQMTSINFQVVDALPDSGASDIIYLLKKDGEADDLHDEYIWVEGKWEKIGTTAVNLADYYTKEETDGRFALKTDIPDMLTREAVEKVLTGNIQSHTHDRVTVIGDFDTDVWDGTTIATSVKGTGTKEDPYVIASCAEWLYFWNNSDSLVAQYEGNSQDATELLTFIRLEKNLDFNNQEINYTRQVSTYLCDVDGQGATISNFIIEGVIFMEESVFGNEYGLANSARYSFFHDFNLKGIQLNADLSSIGTSDFVSLDIFSSGLNIMGGVGCANNYIDATISLSGNITPAENNSTLNIIIVEQGIPLYSLIGYVDNKLLENVYKDKFIAFGTSIKVEDNTVKQDNFVIFVQRSFIFINNTNTLNCSVKGYIDSHSNAIGVDEEGKPITEGDNSFINVANVYVNSQISDIYYSSESSAGYLCSDSHSEASLFVTEGAKTVEELNSDEFINDILNTQGTKFIKGTTTPVIAPSVTKVVYDGYVRQSEFEAFKSHINIQDNNESRFIDLDLDLTQTISSNSSEEIQIETFGRTYEAITNENVIAKLGGVDGIRELTKLLGTTSKPVFVSMPMITAFVAMRTIFTHNVSAFFKSAGGVSTPQVGEIPDGGKVAILFSTVSALMAINISISIYDFNLDTMYAELTVDIKINPISFTNNLIQENNEEN